MIIEEYGPGSMPYFMGVRDFSSISQGVRDFSSAISPSPRFLRDFSDFFGDFFRYRSHQDKGSVTTLESLRVDLDEWMVY
jgi:hypothetical protein